MTGSYEPNASAPAEIVQLAVTDADTVKLDVAVAASTFDCEYTAIPATRAATPAPATSRLNPVFMT